MKSNITIETVLKAHNLNFIKEHKFHEVRKFRFDYAVPEIKLAIEYEGGTWNNGGHVRPQHYSSDCEKYNLAQINGWIVLRYTTDTLKDVGQIYTDILDVKLYRRNENENR